MPTPIREVKRPIQRWLRWVMTPLVCASLAAAAQAPQSVPAPGPATDGPYAPQAILPGGVVVPLFPPGSPFLKVERIKEPEVYNMMRGVPGRIQSVVNIHSPSVEVHMADPNINTGAVIVLAAGGGHNTLNVGTEGADFVPFFYNYGVNTVILRNRLRRDGYNPQTDAIYDALQAIRLVRARAAAWGIDPRKIGLMGFSAGAELAAPAAVMFVDFDKTHSTPGDPLAGISSRPDFVGLVYPGPTPFARDPNTAIPRNVPPAFITSAGSGGASLRFPGAILERVFSYASAHPVADAYRALRQMPYDAPAYDLAAMHYAVHPDSGFFDVSDPGTVTVTDSGGLTFAAGGGSVRRLTAGQEKTTEALEALVALASEKPIAPAGRGRGGD